MNDITFKKRDRTFGHFHTIHLSTVVNPAYQISIVGNFVAANVASTASQRDLGLMFFAIGSLFQLTVFISLWQRLDLLKPQRREKEMGRNAKFFNSSNHPCKHQNFMQAIKNQIWDLPPVLKDFLFITILLLPRSSFLLSFQRSYFSISVVLE